VTDILLETRNLKKYFKTRLGDLHAVDDVNLAINRGETLGIVGESGCGKTTLGRTILRLNKATSGKVLLKGKDILGIRGKESRDVRSQMQLIFQDPFMSLDPRMEVFDLIAEPLREIAKLRNKRELESRVFELMETVGLAERLVSAYPHELDGGRRQRIGVARALAINPEFIVCDEPVSALDVSIQAQILNLLMDLQRDRGLTYMFITHDLSVVKHISNNISVMYLGQIVETADSSELFANPMHPYTQALLKAIPKPRYHETRVRREILQGEVVSPINPKPGCRFASRCKYVRGDCTEEGLQLREHGKNHFVACRLYEK
jgi:peptide/nickel transport system ATP-binding protein